MISLRKTTAALAALIMGSGSALAADYQLDPTHPQVLVMWHYYNGTQQQVLDSLIKEFNETVGGQQGIVVEAYSMGSVDNLNEKLTAAMNGDIGASYLPDMAAAYVDMAYSLDEHHMLANLSDYIPQEELDLYVEGYIREGCMYGDDLYVFPIAKSTEMLLLNRTAWDAFAGETGAELSMLATWEGLTQVAHMYYDWTDAKTETPHDGEAFYGRDAFANYVIIGSLQLGVELFDAKDGEVTIRCDRDVMRKLWDHYVVPYVNGWFSAYGRFRSDDVKTGHLAALVGSTSGATYFPSSVTLDNGVSYPIEALCLPLPGFEGTEPCAVQQGAGVIVFRDTPQVEYAATVFLRWLTQEENNLRFVKGTGYMPVLKSANGPEALARALADVDMSDMYRQILQVAMGITSTYRLYTNRPFRNGYEARAIVNDCMDDYAREAVRRRDRMVQDGADWDETVALLTGNEAFEGWYSGFVWQLDNAVRGE